MLIQQATRTAAVLLCKPVNFLEAKHCLGRAIAGAGVSGCAFGEMTSLYVVPQRRPPPQSDPNPQRAFSRLLAQS
jgi:hypothetical protein